MVEIVAKADQVAQGAIVTGYAVSKDYPRSITQCAPIALTRVYRGFGKMRAESGTPPRKGFGTLIAEIAFREISQGNSLWLRVQD